MFPKTRRVVLVAGSAITSFLLSSRLLAQSPGPGHALRKDYAMEWAGRINLFGVVAAMALVGYVLVFRRRQIAAAASQWMLFIGICVMPLPVMLLGSAVGLEQAKDVSFCRQCHVMGQFVDDMTNPASGRLAAVHFKNRYIQRSHCYVCHTDYGLFGTMEAKLAGVGHIWKEFTRVVRAAGDDRQAVSVHDLPRLPCAVGEVRARARSPRPGRESGERRSRLHVVSRAQSSSPE